MKHKYLINYYCCQMKSHYVQVVVDCKWGSMWDKAENCRRFDITRLKTEL